MSEKFTEAKPDDFNDFSCLYGTGELGPFLILEESGIKVQYKGMLFTGLRCDKFEFCFTSTNEQYGLCFPRGKKTPCAVEFLSIYHDLVRTKAGTHALTQRSIVKEEILIDQIE